MRKNRTAGFAVIVMIYIIAVSIGVVFYCAFPALHLFMRILIGDVCATVFVFLAGVVLQNASVYDPYWSVAPVAVFTGVAADSGGTDTGVILLLIAVWYWGVRLTLNWSHTFKNLATQDWRYSIYKNKYPRSFQAISFFGINMFPTVVVYLCMLPGIAFIRENACNSLTLIGFLVCTGATTLQLIADIQMHRFRHRNSGSNRIIRSGLWKHSRHPNYLGEILMWWGVLIIMLSYTPHRWILGIGPLANTLMFLFVSIPMADKRNRALRPGFDEYVRETNNLLPIKLTAFMRDGQAEDVEN